jgi:hypothetical protein
MRTSNIPSNGIVLYTTSFTPFLDTLAWPVAVIPPALFEILGESVTETRLHEALARLGFREARAVSAGLKDFRENLAGEARLRPNLPLLITACPPVREIAFTEYPELAHMVTSSLPPAEFVALQARREHPEATLFFLSPCSARAASLLSARDADGKEVSLVDFAVPLDTIFPALLDAINAADADCSEEMGQGAKARQQKGVTSDRIRVIASTVSIRSYLDALSLEYPEGMPGSGKRPREPFVELIACEGGCSCGDWAPRARATDCRACADRESAGQESIEQQSAGQPSASQQDIDSPCAEQQGAYRQGAGKPEAEPLAGSAPPASFSNPRQTCL